MLNNFFKYNAKYDSLLLRGIDDPDYPRPWNLFDIIKNYSGITKNLLDIGCGTSFKIIPLSQFFKQLIGIDPSSSMINASMDNIKANSIVNINLLKANGDQLPFMNQSIDIVTCMLSRWNIKEIARVLKPDGNLIIEHIGCEDKKEFKLLFGKDEQGWRGQLIQYNLDEYINIYKTILQKYFTHISIINGFWNTYYSLDGIRLLLENTPTIRNFDDEKDKYHLIKAVELFSTSSGIKLTQNRILIHAKNPRII
jgi:SAM-dependent methyltransferase